MKILIIILFLIFTFVLLLDIKIEIRKIEIVNKKIKFNIYLQIYLLSKIKLYEKRVTKKEILKLIQLSEKRKIIKNEKKLIKNLSIEIEKIDIQILYNLKNPIHMAYIYGVLQAIINILIASINPKSKNIIIKTQYKGNLYVYISTKTKVNIRKTIIKIIKNNIRSISKRNKKICSS